MDIDPAATSAGAVNRAMVAGVGGKLAVTVLNLFIVAVAARSLGAAGFGVVAVLTGLVTTLGFLDLGIGNSVISTISAHLSRDDRSGARAEVANALAATATIGVVIAGGGTTLALLIPEHLIFSAPGVSDSDLRSSFAAFSIALGLAIPGTLGSRICLAEQRGATNNVFLIIGAVVSAVTTLLSGAFSAPVWVFVLSTVAVPNLVLAGQTIHYTVWSRHAVRPQWSAVSWRHLRAITGSSLWFMVLGGCSALASQTAVVVAAYALDSRAAGVVGLATRVFALGTSLFLGGLQQSWASTARALAQGDMDWVRSNFRRVMRLTTAASVVFGVAVAAVGAPLIALWAGDTLRPPVLLLVLLAVWTTYSLVMTQLSFLLNAAGVIRAQALLSVVLVALTLPLSFVVTHAVGITGSTIAMLVAHAVVMAGPLVVLSRRVLART